MKIKHIVLLVLVILGAVLFFQNTQVVTITLFFWQVTMSGIIMFPSLVVIGFALGYLACKFSVKRR
jgi:uncharacterized integral membrane protein